MSNTTPYDALREALAQRSGTQAEDWFLTVKARHGMLVAYRVLAGRRGKGSVLTQLLTCCTAVDPIVAAGLTPVYGDVSPQTLALDSQALPEVEDLRAIVLQNSFGYIDVEGAQSLRDAAHAHGALLVEDCAHCVSRMAKGADAAPLADLSIHSFGVEKMLPTYFGGAVWVSPHMADQDLRAALVDALLALGEPDAHLARTMRSYRTQVRVLNHLPGGLSRVARGVLTSSGAFEAAIAPQELRGGVAHDPSLPGSYVAERALEALRGLDESLRQRVDALACYAEHLGSLPGVRVSQRILESGQPLLRLPLNLPTDAAADAAIAAIARLGLYAVPWYRHLLFPGVDDATAYGVDEAMPPLAHTHELTRGALAVPCDLAPRQVEAVCAAIREAVEASGRLVEESRS